MPIKSSTEPVLKSKDDFWVGDGADLECTIHAFDGLGTTPDESFGTTTTSVSNRSAARKRQREDKKRAAKEQAANFRHKTVVLLKSWQRNKKLAMKFQWKRKVIAWQILFQCSGIILLMLIQFQLFPRYR